MANDNIFQQYLAPPKSVMDYTADLDQADARRQSLQQNALSLAASQQKFGDYQRERDGENQLSRLLSGGGTPDQVAVGLAQAGYGKQALAYTKQQQDLAKAKADTDYLGAQTGKIKSEAGQIDFNQREAKRQKAISDIAAFTDPQQALASLNLHIQTGDVDPAQGEMIKQTIPQNPADFPKWQIGMLQRIMSAKDSAGQIAPDASTVATNERIKTEGGLNRANQIKVQGMIADRQDARGDVEPTLSSDTRARIAKQFLKGDKSGLQNLGRGAQGAANLVAIQNDITAEAARQGMSGEAIAARMAEYSGLLAGMRTSGTISARIENAAAEAEQLVPLALTASQNVVRSGFLPFGRAQMMFDTQSNSPELAEFATANQGLVTAYASAMARGNKPTVSDNEHARELLSTAKSQGAYEATVRQMQREIAAAQRAPKDVRQGLSDEISGAGGHGAPTGQAAPAGKRPTPAGKPSLSDIFGK